MEKYFEDLKKFKNSLSEAGLPADIENSFYRIDFKVLKKVVGDE